ncbi:MAG: MgtC/SapB family protein [Thermodesulfovibrionales bacterium]|nr:MgtC/SapB family protein [Thermodesulfovibrionales bacterium]
MISTEELLFRLALGAVFGGIVGVERQMHGRPAGFRTHILVCTASVLLMEVSAYYHLLVPQDASYVRVDPGRIAAGAITGMGFLGAGVIIKLGASVQGLTTAASLWITSAIGLATGVGLYAESVLTLVITVFSLQVLRVVERHTPHDVVKTLRITTRCEVDDEDIYALLDKYRGRVLGMDFDSDSAGECVIVIRVAFGGRRSGSLPLKDVVTELVALEGVKTVSLKTL